MKYSVASHVVVQGRALSQVGSQILDREDRMNDWTIMVYISADDILANFAVESLKQMKRAAGRGVDVIAQFDANLGGNVPVYAFSDSKKKESSIATNVIANVQGPADMTDPGVLTAFINMATEKYPAKHYGLVLWGHGPELLFDDDVPPSTPAFGRRYFTPANLKKALKGTELLSKEGGKSKLDIIAIDACCMAVVEVAGELRDCANYLISSQDDVPDASFPYEQLLNKLRSLCKKGDLKRISKMIPEAYQEAFQDYIATPANGLGAITLSTLNLDAIETITAPLAQLADALLQASPDPILRKKILDARRASHDFDFGIFVDLLDFCDRLDRTGHCDNDLSAACEKMRNAIDGQSNKCIIEKRASGKDSTRCHGLSVYFPYQTDDATQNAVLLRKNSTAHPSKDRISRIMELEQDYSALTTSGQTGWMDFIKRGWSLILAKEIPDELDKHYSAQQCAENLLPEADRAIALSLASKKLGPQPSSGTGLGPESEPGQKRGTHRTNGAPKEPIIGKGHQYPEKHPPN